MRVLHETGTSGHESYLRDHIRRAILLRFHSKLKRCWSFQFSRSVRGSRLRSIKRANDLDHGACESIERTRKGGVFKLHRCSRRETSARFKVSLKFLF